MSESVGAALSLAASNHDQIRHQMILVITARKGLGAAEPQPDSEKEGSAERKVEMASVKSVFIRLSPIRLSSPVCDGFSVSDVRSLLTLQANSAA